jgi:hypothetical protein
VDPDLGTLHQCPDFKCFIQELATRDFVSPPLKRHRFAAREIPADGQPEDLCSWFVRLLPAPR